MSESVGDFYSISIPDFENAPSKIREYKILEMVDRGNFISLLARGFAVSQGVPVCHQMFMEFIASKTGFDYKETISNFFVAGGWNCLNKDEKKLFLEKFEGVDTSGHKINIHEMKNSLNDQLSRLIFGGSGVDMAIINSWSYDDLMVNIQRKVIEEKEKRKMQN